MEGRYLLGVASTETALDFLSHNSASEIDAAALTHLDARARARREGLEYVPARSFPLSARDVSHVARVRQRELLQTMFADEAVAFRLVEVRRLVVAQPHLNFGYAASRVASDADPAVLNELCLPSRGEMVDTWGGVTAGPRVACTLSTLDLNVTVTGARVDTSDGIHPVFTIGRTAVFCHAIDVGGRLILKNGTHRAVALAAMGIDRMLCLVTPAEPTRLPEGLAAGTLLGDRPPVVADFLDPELYLRHSWPERVKVIRIIADEYVTARMP